MAEDSDSGEKTEEPSQYRLEEFRKKGEVASSKEVNSVLILAATFLTLTLSAVYIYEVLTEFIEWLMTLNPTKIYGEKFIDEVFTKTVWTGLKCTAPIFLCVFCFGFITQLSQIGFIYAPEVLGIKFDRVNPINGFKRLFSKKSLVEAAKGVFKFSIVLAITYFIIKENLSSFMGFLHVEIGESLAYGQIIGLKLAFSILLGLAIIAMLDFFWEKYAYKEKLKMTKQQAKEEHKEKEGNPEIKQKIKSIQRELSQKRMMADVPKADVIVTNPTHISVALKYDNKTMVAPEVLAKGADEVAMKIRELARDHEIPIVENIPLARTLYKTVKIGEGVPRNLYRAVAEVLGFVYKKKRKKLGARV